MSIPPPQFSFFFGGERRSVNNLIESIAFFFVAKVLSFLFSSKKGNISKYPTVNLDASLSPHSRRRSASFIFKSLHSYCNCKSVRQFESVTLSWPVPHPLTQHSPDNFLFKGKHNPVFLVKRHSHLNPRGQHFNSQFLFLKLQS